MDVEPFALERWFARFEHDADIMLAESGIRSLDAARFDRDPGELGYVIPTNGDPAFRETIGDRYDRPADEVLFTCGAQEANLLAFLALVGRGDHAVVVTPTYQSLVSLPAAFGEVTTVDLTPPEWDLDVEAVKEAIRPETGVVVLNNPNNPTGKYLDESTVEAVYDVAADAGAYLLCDEVYRLLAEAPLPPVASLGEFGVSTSSVTKSYGLAGLRFGWLAGPREVVDAAWNWKDYTTISPSQFGQHLARQAIESENDILAVNRELAAENRAITREWVERHDLSWFDPVGVNGFVTVPEGFDSGESFCRHVVEETGVVLAPGEAFGHPDRFRIGFGLATDELEAGLARVDALLARHG
ncbi:aminotransferase class I/II-fold pyridoxal phosphate-dependent enzyme [Halomarina litorea]|uniref:aminotransferase class I/II-fold pyridoxal phosphate-dependent enzyme n=1 Tax=Halomarina litorea TaxID=2961595 RepID=UPI0020C3FBE8|nr:aminotransferase class I/II-fold pyridoxal phosphate-dependent enzyme [Halomarina sp. BCD28]